MTDFLVVRKGGIATAVNDAIAAQKGAANGMAPLDADSKVPAVNSRVESVAGRQGAITLAVADVSGALNKAGDTMTGTLVLAASSFGTAAGTIAQGNDTRLSDTRTPTDATVTPAKMSADNKGVIICTSTTRPASPVKGQLIYETDTEQLLKNTGTPAAPVWANTATASAVATETAAGVVELATADETQTGTDGVRAVHPAGLKSTMNARRGTTRVTAYTVNNVSIGANATLTTVDLRGLGTPAIPADAKSVDIAILGSGTGFYIAVDSADVTPDGFSPRLYITANGTTSVITVPLGTGVNAGKIKLLASGAVTNVYMWPTSWFR